MIFNSLKVNDHNAFKDISTWNFWSAASGFQNPLILMILDDHMDPSLSGFQKKW